MRRGSSRNKILAAYWPRRFTAIISSQISGVKASRSPAGIECPPIAMAALLTKMSRPPSCPVTCAIAASMTSGILRSRGTVIDLRPSASILFCLGLLLRAPPREGIRLQRRRLHPPARNRYAHRDRRCRRSPEQLHWRGSLLAPTFVFVASTLIRPTLHVIIFRFGSYCEFRVERADVCSRLFRHAIFRGSHSMFALRVQHGFRETG